MEEIKAMPKNMFKTHIKKKIECEALTYLKSKIKSKGKEIYYTQIELQEYLRPESKLKIVEKNDIFKIRSRMVDLKGNIKGKYTNYKCEPCSLKGIKKKETQKHVFKCSQLNTEVRNIKYKDIFGSNINKMKYIMKRMNQNLSKLKQLTRI